MEWEAFWEADGYPELGDPCFTCRGINTETQECACRRMDREGIASRADPYHGFRDQLHDSRIGKLPLLSNADRSRIEPYIEKLRGARIVIGDADVVTHNNMRSLRYGKWLSDEIIHAFFRLLRQKNEEMQQQDPYRRPIHYCSSFFFNKLYSDQEQYRFANVSRWGRKVPGGNVFDLDKLIINVNAGSAHWWMAVVDFEGKGIVGRDSMRNNVDAQLSHIFRYLQDEYRTVNQNTRMPDIDKWQLDGANANTPTQRNGHDCGVFVCMFALYETMGWNLSTRHRI